MAFNLLHQSGISPIILHEGVVSNGSGQDVRSKHMR